MNIQFMTAEKNGVPTGEKDWRGEPRYRYTPDYAEMISHASCEEEIEAIKEAERVMKNGGFTFEIVFTAKALSIDPHTYESKIKWQVLQHPWYRNNGIYTSKEEMLKDIEETFK